MNKIAIMLGGNLPGTPQAISEAVKKFAAAGMTGITVGRTLSSAAVDCIPGTPDFLDTPLCGTWHASPLELLELCQRIEREAGRPALHSSRESRILDCDIILFGTLQLSTPRLTIPHPRARERHFVLEPLSEIAPDMLFPDGISVREAWQLMQKNGSSAC